MFGDIWIPVSKQDMRAFGLYRRHYSFRQREVIKARYFMGPSETLVLMTPCCRALFGWGKQDYRMDGLQGINCTVFRNEGAGKSSELILEAEKMAQEKWPNERMFTFVAPDKVNSVNPGYCFKMAGWRKCGESAKGLHILEKWPDANP